MNPKETILPFTDEDRKKLRTSWIMISLILIGVMVVFSIVSYYIGWHNSGLFPKVFSSIFALFPVGILIYVSFSYFKDINTGTKKVIKGIVTDKQQETRITGTSKNRSTTTDYYIYIDGIKNTVDGKYYNKCLTGDSIELQIASISKTNLDLIVTNRKHVENKHSNPNTKTNNDYYSTYDFNSPSYEEMNEDEIKILTIKRNRKFRSTLIWSVILGYIGYWFLNILILVILGLVLSIKNHTILKFGFNSVYIIIGALIIWAFYKRVLPYHKDINERMKTVTLSIIDDKVQSNVLITKNNWKLTSSSGNYFYFIIKNKYYPVTKNLFSVHETNDEIYLHESKNSKQLFGITEKK